VLLAALALLAVVVFSRTTDHAPRRPPPPAVVSLGEPALLPSARTELGVNLNIPFLDSELESRQELHVRAAGAHGVRLARADALWAGAEPVSPALHGRHEFDWRRNDRIAGLFARAHIRWWVILDFCPAWAAQDRRVMHSPPRSNAEFATYAHAFAKRYGRGGRFWRLHPELRYLPVTDYEAWNEPDSSAFWRPQPDPPRYLDMYLRTRNEIKKVDPGARVIVGGLTRHGAGFLTQLLRVRPDVAKHVDGVGLHPYGATPADVFEVVHVVRRTLAGLGAGAVPLYLTEYGWQDSRRAVRYYAPPPLKADYITSSVLGLERSRCGVAAVLLYTWTTLELNPLSVDDWFGIYAPRGGERPASLALGALLREDPARTREEPRAAPVADC
jgi:hypothetical protein